MATLIPSATLSGTTGILESVSVSLMCLGGLNWLSEGIGAAAGAKKPNLVAGMAGSIGLPELATFVYLLVGLASAYYFVQVFIIGDAVDGKKSQLSEADRYYSYGFIATTAIVALWGGYGMYA